MPNSLPVRVSRDRAIDRLSLGRIRSLGRGNDAGKTASSDFYEREAGMNGLERERETPLSFLCSKILPSNDKSRSKEARIKKVKKIKR